MAGGAAAFVPTFTFFNHVKLNNLTLRVKERHTRRSGCSDWVQHSFSTSYTFVIVRGAGTVTVDIFHGASWMSSTQNCFDHRTLYSMGRISVCVRVKCCVFETFNTRDPIWMVWNASEKRETQVVCVRISGAVAIIPADKLLECPTQI